MLEFMGLDWHAWLTVILVFFMFGTLIKSKLPADIVFLGVIGLLIVTGCLSTADALSGFSSTTVVVVGVLFVVVAGLEETGVLHWTVKYLLGTPSSYGKAIIRLMLPVAALSAFLSNTTVVALFIQVVKMWAKKLNIAPSKLLIPLSYAAGMGGVCTLIGTPPNLIISGFYTEATGNQLGIFFTTAPGLFCLIVGVVTIILLQRLLPVRKTPEDEFEETSHGAVSYLYVDGKSHLPGQSLGDIHLLESCKNCTLLGIVRFDGEVEHIDQMSFKAAADVPLMGEDTLIFTGEKTDVERLANQFGFLSNSLNPHKQVSIGIPTLLASCIMIGMVLLSSFNVIPLLDSCIIAALLMLVTRCCSVKNAKKSINWDVLMVFAASIALGKAIDSTGLAQLLADNMHNLCGNNATMALIIICTLGTFLTEFVSNTACGAIMAPIAIKIAATMGANPLTFCLGLMISVSSSFATPIGSPTHLMVYAPGGYRFTDFMRIGLPMNFIILAANIIICLLLFPL